MAQSEVQQPAPLNVVAGVTLLLVYQLFGEAVVLIWNLPFPGPVVGMAALFVTLVFRGGWPASSVEYAASGLLRHFSLLFVPAGVGVMVHADRLGSELVPIVAALVLSTLASLVVAALAMRLLSREEAGNGG